MASPWTADSGTVTADSPYYRADGSYVVPGASPQLSTIPTGVPVQTSLQTTINAYLYQDFADDDNILAFIDAYNALSQYYLDWFNANPLTFYPGLSGAQLDFVAEGVYGISRTSLASPVNPPAGPLNTAELNTFKLNSFTPATQTFYALTDDVFQRIITWHFFKGDGTRFCLRWLKRRIMRFILGANGLDPSPWYPSAWPGVGVENTQAISVSISGSTLTVSINGAAISAITQLTPGILQYFQLAFQGGVLQMPAQFTSLVCNIVWSLTATANPSAESVTGIATTLSTGSAIVTAIGGNGQYTYSWTWQSGGSGITINSPTSNATSFTASGMARGSSRSGVALCTVMDSASHSATAVVSVTIQNVSAPSLSISPTSVSNSGANSTELTGLATANVSGGSGPYTYSWVWQAGGSGIVITNPSNSSTSFEASGLSPGQTVSGTAQCTVTDAYGQQVSATCNVTLSRVTLVSASCAPTSESSSSSTQPITTGTTTVTASGGGGSYTYQWSWQSGGADISINSVNSSSTSFTGNGLSPGQTASGVARCVVSDVFGQTATTTCSVSITYLPPETLSYTAAQNVTVPNGYSTADIEGWGGGGGGQGGSGGSLCLAQSGAGAGAGGYFRSRFSVSGGQTIAIGQIGAAGTGGVSGYGVGAAGTATSVTYGASTMTANGGQPGNNSGGAGGAASGGNISNVTGGSGSASEPNGGSGAPGLAQNGTYGNNPATNGNGGGGGLRAGQPGKAGLVVIRFS